MTCNFPVQTLTSAFGFLEWLAFNLFVSNTFLYLLWRQHWYKAVTNFIALPIRQTFFFACMTILAVLNGWAAFALWHCKNWDADFAPLFVNILMVIFINGFPFIVMLTRNSFVYWIMALACLGLSAAFTGLGWIHDTFAGIVGLIDIAFSIGFFVFSFYAWMNRKRIDEHHVQLHLNEKQIAAPSEEEEMGATETEGEGETGEEDDDFSDDDDVDTE
jgi:hypothetical protein